MAIGTMEALMFEQPNIRRHDGSIDIDFYRQAGLTQHRSVTGGFPAADSCVES
jgi:hypothetical protein